MRPVRASATRTHSLRALRQDFRRRPGSWGHAYLAGNALQAGRCGIRLILVNLVAPKPSFSSSESSFSIEESLDFYIQTDVNERGGRAVRHP